MFNILEILEVIITIAAVSYILKPYLKTGGNYKPVIMISTLSIVLHEFAHKFTALGFGLSATYHANLWGLGIGLVFRYFHLPLFFIPAYVRISGGFNNVNLALTAIAGPLTNIAIFSISYLLLRYASNKKFIYENAQSIYSLMVINKWLAIFNLIPIPGTDGFQFINSIFI